MDNFINANILTDNIELNENHLQFYELSGRKAYWSQSFYGEGVTVAVIDTGVSKHNDIKDVVLDTGKAFVNYGQGSTEDDSYSGHGTACASVINRIAPKAKILPIKVLNPIGDGDFRDIIKSLEWLIDWRDSNGNPVDIVSMSLSTSEVSKEIERKLVDVVRKLNSMNVSVIVSSGNNGKEQYNIPSKLDDVICVGAVDHNKNKALFSTTGNHVDLCQVGVDVVVASNVDKKGYRLMDGTSFSTPIVAGISALVKEKYKKTFGKTMSDSELFQFLKMNTKDLGIQGVDSEYGVGFCTLNPLNIELEVRPNDKNMVVNKNIFELDVPATIIDGRFVIPLRRVTENLGASVIWDNEDRKAIIRF